MADIHTPDGFPAVQTIRIEDACEPAALKAFLPFPACESAGPAEFHVTSVTDARQLFRGRHAVAVIGTRDASPYGRDVTKQIIRALAEREDKPVIISGLALGIDQAAHRAALDCGLDTIAVMPCGPDTIYPGIHLPLAREIASRPRCALVSCFPPGTPAMPFNFLYRNRLIAALCGETVLVESKDKGSAIVCARLARSFGGRVWAVPGRIGDLRSAGCNRLIREGTAEILADIAQLS